MGWCWVIDFGFRGRQQNEPDRRKTLRHTHTHTHTEREGATRARARKREGGGNGEQSDGKRARRSRENHNNARHNPKMKGGWWKRWRGHRVGVFAARGCERGLGVTTRGRCQPLTEARHRGGVDDIRRCVSISKRCVSISKRLHLGPNLGTLTKASQST